MNRIKISVPMGGRILTLGKNGPIVTPEITDLNTAEGILREGHKVYYHKVDGTSEELTLEALYVLMEAEQMTPTVAPMVGEEKIKKVLTKLGVSFVNDLDDNGTLGGKEGIKKILSKVGTVKTLDSITGVDNMLDTLADWGFSRARLNDDGATVPTEKIILIISTLFNMELRAFDIAETFSEAGWLPTSLTELGATAGTYGIYAGFAIAQKRYEFYGWQASPLQMDAIYAENFTSIYIMGDTDASSLRDKLIALSNNPAYDVLVIGAEDENMANWVGDSALNPAPYETDPYLGRTIVFPPKWNM